MKPVHATVAEKSRGACSHQSGNEACSHQSGNDACSHQSGNEACSHQSGNEACSHHLGSKACSNQMGNEACSHKRGSEARSGHNTEQRCEALFTLQKQRKFTLQKQKSDRWRCPPRFLSRQLASNTHVTPSPPNEVLKVFIS